MATTRALATGRGYRPRDGKVNRLRVLHPYAGTECPPCGSSVTTGRPPPIVKRWDILRVMRICNSGFAECREREGLRNRS
jgi:hypothetical protein